MQIDKTMMHLKKIQEQVAKMGDLPGPRFDVHLHNDHHLKDCHKTEDHTPLQEAA